MHLELVKDAIIFNDTLLSFKDFGYYIARTKHNFIASESFSDLNDSQKLSMKSLQFDSKENSNRELK